MRIAIVSHTDSGAPDFARLQDVAAALQVQVDTHFCPAYNVATPASVVAVASPLPTDWVIGLFKDADQPGALGYHDVTPQGLPLAKVFPLLDAQDGAELSVTISHELLEMLADPYLMKAVQSEDGRFWAYEVCDAVESGEYVVGDVRVSNFVYPAYFEPPRDLAGVHLDHLGAVTVPYQVLPGGYMQWHGGDAGGWHQVVHREAAPRPYRARPHARPTRRRIARAS